MSIQRISMGKKIPATLAAAAGIVAFGLLGTPIASAQDASACDNVDPATGACLDSGGDRHSVPDPTKYGCPAGDYTCMFNHAGPPGPKSPNG
jgi:hypothetical protein